MSRKSGPDDVKLKKIRKILKQNPSGLWVREIARRTGVSKSTVSLYLERYMKDEIEELFVTENQWIRIVRLR